MTLTYIWRSLVAGIFLSSTVLTFATYANIIDPELDAAVSWMHENQMTKFDNAAMFRPEDSLTREQAAKFFVNFTIALDLWLQNTVDDEECDFADLGEADSTLTEYIYTSCKLGLFRGANWSFFPTEAITKAQAITVLIRAIQWPQDETTIPRRKNYYQQARALSLTKEKDVNALDVDITRYEMALILYRARTDNESNPEEEIAQINEIIDILKQLGLQSS